MAGIEAQQAWPFLIARGRRKGYSVLLAPGFLVADREHGFLEDIAGPTRPNEPIRIAAAATPTGRRLSLVWTDYRVLHADVASDGAAGAAAHPVDEHSRPLRLLHGFLLSDGHVTGAEPADLERTREAALDTYRRFLADEEHFTIEESAPLPIASAVVQLAPTTPLVPAPTRRRIPATAYLVLAALVAGIGLLLGRVLLDGGQPVRIGDTVQGTIERPGEVDSYDLDTGEATRFHLDGASRRDGLRVNLKGPAVEDPIPDDNEYYVQPSAPYRLEVSWRSDATGPYKFRLFGP